MATQTTGAGIELEHDVLEHCASWLGGYYVRQHGQRIGYFIHRHDGSSTIVCPIGRGTGIPVTSIGVAIRLCQAVRT